MRLLVDTTPLRVSRDFRRLWIGQAVSFFGSMITTAALPYQVFHQTGSSLAVGTARRRATRSVAVVLARRWRAGRRLRQAAAAARRHRDVDGVLDRARASTPRSIIRSCGCSTCSGAAASAMFAVSFPVLRSLLPLLLDDDLRPAAFALQSTYGSFGMMAGPARRRRAHRLGRPHQRLRRRRRHLRARARRVRRHRAVAAASRRAETRRARRSWKGCGSFEDTPSS